MEVQLVSFGNYLLKTYGVNVHSNDGKNTPIYQREVTDADLANWKVEGEFPSNCTYYPSRHSLQQVVGIKFKNSIEPMNATIIGIHVYEGKIKYDVALWIGDGSVDDSQQQTRIYNVDSCFVIPV